VQAEKNVDVQSYVRTWLAAVKIPSSLRLTIDIDPISFF
jgi:primosomal protein N' (replication factor Y)